MSEKQKRVSIIESFKDSTRAEKYRMLGAVVVASLMGLAGGLAEHHTKQPSNTSGQELVSTPVAANPVKAEVSSRVKLARINSGHNISR